MTLIHIVGARPNFMKASPVVDALDLLGADQQLIHMGQHYDAALSQVFFDQLGLPEPDRYLGVGSGSHGVQTARLLESLEQVFAEEAPSGVVVYGDVNSTIAAALAASKLSIPIAHVEAGLRSFDRTMPEEVNRVLTDAISELHLVTSADAMAHLAAEGLPESGMRFVGNPMIDTLERVRPTLDPRGVLDGLGISGSFGLVTMHRPGNVDDPVRARAIVDALAGVASMLPLVFPLHPRGRDSLERVGLGDIGGLLVVEPLGYLAFTSLMASASIVLTDSGGVQEETTMLDTPCLTVRPNTERPITITHGTNRLVEPDEILGAAGGILDGTTAFPVDRPPLWDGRAGERCARELVSWIEAT